MGSVLRFCRPNPEPERKETSAVSTNKIQQIDVVKSKLKLCRDKITNFVRSKQKERDEATAELKVRYAQGQTKKQLVPLLEARKQLEELIQNGNTRLVLINKSIRDLEMQHMNAQIVGVLDDSNKYMQKVQQELEDKDWRGIMEQANQKYQGVEWEDQQEEDPKFQELWKELGGDKMEQKLKPQQAAVQAKQVKPVAVEQRQAQMLEA